MQPWQQVATVATFSSSWHSTPSLPMQIDPSYFNSLAEINDSYFNVDEFWQEIGNTQSENSYSNEDEFVEESNHHHIISSFEEEMLNGSIPVNMCMDGYWHGQCSDNHVHANTDCPTPLHLLESPIISDTNTSSSACGSSNMCMFPFGETYANGTHHISFIHPSPTSSEASSFTIDTTCINDSVNWPNTDVYIHAESNASIELSYSQIPTHGNEYASNSNSRATDAIFSGNGCDVSSLTPIQNSLYNELNVNIASLEPSLLHMGAPSNHRTATRSSGAQASEHSVSFLVENATIAIADGYVWHKYGQKQIKEKKYPRAYFKCAQPSCPVKKQAESSSDPEGSVLITYFGKHNHHHA